MEDNTQTPISTLKVDFGCTKDCPMDVKNMLQQLKGVKSISIDPNKGKVTVVGNVNPMMLIKLLQKMGKKAQLSSFVRAPTKSRARSHPKQKQSSHCCRESSDSEDESETDHDDDCIHRARCGQRSKGRHGHKDRFGFGTKHVAAPPVTGYHPPMSGYHQPPMSGYHYPPHSGYYHHPPMPWYQNVAYARPSAYLRSKPLYGCYGQGHSMWPTYRHFDSRFPKYNPMIHYTSYADNYRYTV